MKNILKIIVICAVVMQSATAAPPKLVASEYITSAGGMFFVAEEKIFYVMDFDIIKELPKEVYFSFRFENPEKNKFPITDTPVLEIEGNHIRVQSAPLECIRNKRNYKVVMDIYRDSSRADKISTHIQSIEFNFPKRMMKQLGIKKC